MTAVTASSTGPIYRYSDEVSASFGRGYLHPRDLPGSAACSTG